ncbi:MAG: hypothetical protein SPH44_04670 [Eubacteriales bacterium]|nr:hypothetical protein [Clostridiales bacterium]MDY5230399.1 hypothetical protein [Eubacteriales bacterium]
MFVKFRDFIYKCTDKAAFLILAAYTALVVISSVSFSKGIFYGLMLVLMAIGSVLIEPIIDNFIFNLFSKATVSFKSVYKEFLQYNAAIRLIPVILSLLSVFNFFEIFISRLWIIFIKLFAVIAHYVFYTDIFVKRYQGRKKVMVILCSLYCLYYVFELYRTIKLF